MRLSVRFRSFCGFLHLLNLLRRVVENFGEVAKVVILYQQILIVYNIFSQFSSFFDANKGGVYIPYLKQAGFDTEDFDNFTKYIYNSIRKKRLTSSPFFKFGLQTPRTIAPSYGRHRSKYLIHLQRDSVRYRFSRKTSCL